MDRPTLASRLRAAYRAAADALSTKTIRRTVYDQRRLTQASVSPAMIESALSQAAQGDMIQLGDLYDLLAATDPHIRGVRRQLKAGVLSLPRQVMPANDTPEAERIAEAVRSQVERPDGDLETCIAGIVEAELRGVGLVETLWNDPGSALRTWTGFSVVPHAARPARPQQRRDSRGGRPVTAEGIPLGEMAAGKFLRVITRRGRAGLQPARDVPLDSGRLARPADGARLGAPVARAVRDADPGRQVQRRPGPAGAGERIRLAGAAGALVVSKNTDVDWGTVGASSGGQLIHEHYMERSAARISVAFLGAEQTVTVQANQAARRAPRCTGTCGATCCTASGKQSRA